MKFALFRQLGLAFLIVSVAAAAAVLNVPSVNSGVKNAVYSALKPVQSGVWMAGANMRSFFDKVARMSSAAAENEVLELRVNDLMAKVAELEEVKKENDFLRQGLNLELDKDFDLKLARIVAHDVARDVIIIDQGENDLVQEGMPVITSERSVVGRVSKTYRNFSEVTLVTANDFSFDVKIGQEMIDGLVKGGGRNKAAVDFVPKDKKLEDGAEVWTSQLGGIFPGGLLVGTVMGVNNSDVDTFQSSGLSLAFSVDGSLRVFVASGKLPLGFNVTEISKRNE